MNDFYVSESEGNAAFATDLLTNGRIAYNLNLDSSLASVVTHDQALPATALVAKGNRLIILTQDPANQTTSIEYVDFVGIPY